VFNAVEFNRNAIISNTSVTLLYVKSTKVYLV